MGSDMKWYPGGSEGVLHDVTLRHAQGHVIVVGARSNAIHGPPSPMV